MNDRAARRSRTALDPTQVDDARLLLAAIAESSNDVIIAKSLDGVISSWNLAAQRLFGYSEREAIGQSIKIIIPPELHGEEAEILRRVRSGERIEHLRTRRVTREGRSVDVSITVSPVRDASGTPIGASKILRDVTESRRLQAAQRTSDERLAREVAGARTLQAISTRLITERAPGALFTQILEAAMELMASHAASLQMLAPDGKTLLLLAWRNFHADSATFWARVTADAGSTCGVALRDNARVLVADVESCAFMAGTQDLDEYRRSAIRAVQSTPLCSRLGRPLGMISTHWRAPHTPTEDDFRMFDVLARQAADLIERARAEEAVRESEERFRLIANAAPGVIWMSDASQQCTYVNQTWLDLTGQSFEAALGIGWVGAVHVQDGVRCWDIYTRAFERRESFPIECRLRHRSGGYRWMVGTSVPRYSGDGSFAGYIGSAIDVTERRRAEEALATIEQRLIDAQEVERIRIARDLHDDVTQRLALLSIGLDSLAKAAPASAAERRSGIEEARDEVVNLARDVQALSRCLHPGRLEHLGIAAAAAALCGDLSTQHGVEIAFTAEGIPDDLSRRIALCLYRVLQEALQNAIKHSGSARFEVSLRGGSDQIALMIRDRGIGFDAAAVRGQGLGLISMQERLKVVHGYLTIRSLPQHGTTIHANVPLTRDALSGPERYRSV
jgi:PAS domain S-box-containing protein